MLKIERVLCSPLWGNVTSSLKRQNSPPVRLHNPYYRKTSIVPYLLKALWHVRQGPSKSPTDK